VLKLGGSVVTVKDKPLKADTANIERLSEEISKAGLKQLVIVHGGGSFGHPVARRYGIMGGDASINKSFGVSETHRAMVALNSLIVDALLALKVPALSISPSSFFITDEGRIKTANFTIIHRLVDLGIIPVLYGDVVLDQSRGFSILSGDQLASRIAVELGASRLVFGVDVDGIYSSDPKITPGAHLRESLQIKHIKDLVDLGEALTTDVTGGMLGKVMEASVTVEAGVEVIIANASKAGVIFKALIGEPVTGTILTG